MLHRWPFFCQSEEPHDLMLDLLFFKALLYLWPINVGQNISLIQIYLGGNLTHK